MTETTAITTQTTPTAGQLAYLHDGEALNHIWRLAKFLSASKLVPSHFQSRPEDCMVAVMMAQQLGVDALQLTQNVYMINGRPGLSAPFAIALANSRGPFAGPITWCSKGQGDDLEVTAQATVRSTGERVTATCSMLMAKVEQWTKNPKYRSIPEHMLKLRSAAWLIRTTCPEVLFGFYTDEEVETMPVKVVSGTTTKPTQPAETTSGSGDVIGELNAAIRQSVSISDRGEPLKHEQPEPVDDVEVDDPF